MNYNILVVGAHTGWSMNDDIVLNKLALDIPTSDHWNCIFIEPVEELFNILKQNMLKRFPDNNFKYENCAIGNTSGQIKLFKPKIGLHCLCEPEYIEKELPYFVDMLTSVSPNHVKDHHINLDVEEITVPCLTLNDLFLKHNITNLNFLITDTEGNDFDVLYPFNFNVKPNKIKFEHKHIDGSNKPKGEKYNLLINKLMDNGYKIVSQDTEDTIVSLV